jgi:hypothetical protein
MYNLDNGVVVNEDGKDYGKLIEFLESDFDLVSALKQELTFYTNVFHSSKDREHVRKLIEDHLEDHYTALFEDKDELDDQDIDREGRKLIKNFKNHSKDLEKLIRNQIDSIFKKTKTGGEDMFKNLKEAKLFTSHLDALASEIESLEDVSTDMRKHLAYRLDRLSDLIEGASANKEASMEKEANGVGSGSWAYDQDEARYMSSMGGTGSLEGDSDESRYMNLFKSQSGLAADHQEVLKRTEPSQIMGAGARAKQPSDNYNEQEVANKLRSYVKKAMAKLK